jgi:hypothetical protein
MNGSTNSLQYIKKNRRFSQEEKLRNGEVKSTDSTTSTPPAYGSVTRLRAGTDLAKSPLVRRSVGDIQQATGTGTEEVRMSTMMRPSTLINGLSADNSGLPPQMRRVSRSEPRSPNVVEPAE